MRIAATALAVFLLSAAGVCAQPAAQGATAFMAQNAQAEGVHALPSGVQYKVIKAGPGTSRRPTPRDFVKVAYVGSLLSGKIFDSTIDNPDPPMFQLRTLIPGWVEVVQQMQEGDEWMIWVPPELGYGANGHGPIPGGSVLVFRLRLVSILGG